jgi:hypothetical protein
MQVVHARDLPALLRADIGADFSGTPERDPQAIRLLRYKIGNILLDHILPKPRRLLAFRVSCRPRLPCSPERR